MSRQEKIKTVCSQIAFYERQIEKQEGELKGELTSSFGPSDVCLVQLNLQIDPCAFVC